METENTFSILEKIGCDVVGMEGPIIYLKREVMEEESATPKRTSTSNGIYGQTALSYLTSELPACETFNKVLCGTAYVEVPDELSDFLGRTEKMQSITCTLALGELEGEDFKTACTIVTLDKKSLVFSLLSETSGDVNIRNLTLTPYEDGEASPTLESAFEGDAVWNAYTSVIDLLNNVKEWQVPDFCNNCPLKKAEESSFT